MPVDPATTLTILKTLMAVAQAYAPATNGAVGDPSHPPSISRPQSLGDAGDSILRCYHPTGHVLNVSPVEHPWSGGDTFKASSSVVLRIDWKGGFVGRNYSSFVALMERNGSIKTILLKDGANVPPNPRCQLDQWMQVQGSL